MFTFCTLVTSVILYQGLKASATQIITVVLGFFVICTGIFILQMSKVDPRELTSVDRRTTLLLQAARVEINPKSARDLERQASGTSQVSGRRSTHSYHHSRIRHTAINGADLEALADGRPPPIPEPHVLNAADCDPAMLNEEDLEAGLVDLDSEDETRAVVEKTEDPGMDSLRGTFGAIGTIIRARRRATALSQSRSLRNRSSSTGMVDDMHSRRGAGTAVTAGGDVEKSDFKREALTDSPVVNGNGRVLVASPLSTPGSLEIRRKASVHFTGSDSAPVTLDRRGEDGGDPMVQAGAAIEEATRARAQTLPTT
jgi:hypothetical protein